MKDSTIIAILIGSVVVTLVASLTLGKIPQGDCLKENSQGNCEIRDISWEMK